MLGKAILIVGIIVLISAILSDLWAASRWILAVGVVIVLAILIDYDFLKFSNKDGDEPDALEGDKDEEENKKERRYDRRM